MLQINDTAPDFNIKTTGNTSIKLSSFNPQMVVLFFFPRADTPGCTLETTNFSTASKEFSELNTNLIGISKDNVATQTKFQKKYDITVYLGSDSDTHVCEQYGVWKEKNMYGKKINGIERTTFLIDKERKIINIWNKVKPIGHVEEVLSFVRKLNN
jgi:peroxiredoxin Q/BCP